MILEDILAGKIFVSFTSKNEAVEYMEYMDFLCGIFDHRFEETHGMVFYQHAEFYDRCVTELGACDGNEPTIRIERRSDGSYNVGYDKALYYRKNGRECVYYQDIRDELFGADDNINPANDIDMLFS